MFSQVFVCPQGYGETGCVVKGVCGAGGVVKGDVVDTLLTQRQTQLLVETATEVGGTHPTRMHSSTIIL